jgi:hypothetical protein
MFFDQYTYNSASTAEPHFGYFDSTGNVTAEVTVKVAYGDRHEWRQTRMATTSTKLDTIELFR